MKPDGDITFRVCTIPVDIQKPSGHGPGQLTLGGPARSGALDQKTFRDPFQPQLFCDTKFL